MLSDRDMNVNIPRSRQERIRTTFIPEYSEEFIDISEQQYNDVLYLIATHAQNILPKKTLSSQELNFLLVVAFLQYKHKRVWLTTGELAQHMQKSHKVICKYRNLFNDGKLLIGRQRLPSSLFRNKEGYDSSARFYQLAPLFKRLIKLQQVQS